MELGVSQKMGWIWKGMGIGNKAQDSEEQGMGKKPIDYSGQCFSINHTH